MFELFGHYFEHTKVIEETEHLKLDLSVSPNLLNQCWNNNSLASDFLSHYIATCFPSISNHYKIPEIKALKSTVSFIVNELLENSFKYALKNQPSSRNIAIYLHQKKLIIECENETSEIMSKKYQKSIDLLLHHDLDQLFLNRLENQAKSKSIGQLGLITILRDYPTTIGWKFKLFSNKVKIKTQVQLEI